VVDWEQESAKMASTYSNCYLNLAATQASNGTGGCLSERWTPAWASEASYNLSHERKPVVSHEICIRGEATGVLVRKSLRIAHAQCTSDLAHEFPLDQTAPLLSRAWFYQERLLSPRTVHFHCSEMIWHCMEAVSCECGSLDKASAAIEYLGRATFPKYTFRLLDNDDYDGYSQHGFQIVLWLTIVHQYSKMRLTHSDDMFPALGGVAFRFRQRVDPGRYLAGLWESELAMCLLWQVYSNPEANPSRKYIDTARPTTYRAPTWSWASFDFDPAYRAAISYYEVINYGFEVDSIVSASTEQAGSNEFGRVTGGRLQLQCRVVDGFLDPVSSMITFRNHKETSSRVPSNSPAEHFPKWHEVNLDCIENLPPEMRGSPDVENIEAVCCLVVATFGATGDNVTVVVRELEGNKGTFERIGYMKIDPDLFIVENAVLKLVSIV
jgi:hypothetical protein